MASNSKGKEMYKALLVLFMVSTITGCTTSMKGQFDCPGTPGVQCKNISKVNKMVDQGAIPKEKGVDVPIVRNSYKGKVLKRTKEEVLTVWVAPFEDEEGIYHEPGVLTAVVSPARWELSKA